MDRRKQTPLPVYIRTFVEEAKTRIHPFVLTGELNRDYISGDQFKKIDPNTKTIVKKNPPKNLYLERKIINRMMPIYLTRNGILSDNKPIPGFKPNPGDPEAHDYSIEGNKFFGELLNEIDYNTFYNNLIEEADVYPLAWVKSGIDFSKGDLIKTVKSKVKDAKGEEKEKTVRVYEGRPFVEVVPLHEVAIDTVKVKKMSQIQELVHRRPLPLDVIKRKYGFEAEQETIETNYIPKKFLLNDSTSSHDNHAYVYEYYRASDASYPKGRYVITINDQVLWDGDLPFENGGHNKRLIPFDPVRLQTMPGFLPGVTVYSQLIDQQDTYNAVYNRTLEYINRIGIGKKYAWKGSLIDEDSMDNAPGTITWLTRFGKKPENDNIDPIGFEFMTYLQSLEENMLVTAGLSALTAYGQSQSHMRTDGVVDKITESDTNKLGNAMKNLSDGIIAIMRKLVNLEKQRHYRLVNELKLDKIDDYVSKYNIEDIDASQIVIVNREFLMQSDQVIEKKMAQATSLGLYNPEAGLSYRSKLKALDMIQANYLSETLSPVESANWGQIQNEHKKLFCMEEIEVKHYQNHQMHIEEHQLLLMSPKLEKLKYTDKATYDFIIHTLEEHILQHQEYYQEPQQQQVFNDAKAIL